MSDGRADSVLLAKLMKSAKNLTNEIGVDWDEIPATIAESTLFELCSHYWDDRPSITLDEIAYELGFMTDDGDLL